jgi:hypothetical protein
VNSDFYFVSPIQLVHFWLYIHPYYPDAVPTRHLLLLIQLSVLLTLSSAVAQRSVIWKEKPGTWSLNVGTGPARYLGDLNERFDFAHLRLGLALSAAATYRVTNQLALRGDVGLYYIRGSHKDTYRSFNNLSFHSVNPELVVGFQYDIWRSDNNNYAVVPYAIAGAGLTYMTPRADYKGISYSLAPLHTEGVAYNRLPLVLRYGIGLPLFNTDRFKGNLEGVYTHVMSDYLDDVSTRYIDRSSMPTIAASLADRAPEIGMPPNPAGATRGNPRRNDGYLTLSARLVFIFITPSQRNYRRMFSR